MAKFDRNKQKQEFERLKREFLEITRRFEATKAASGFTDEDLKNPAQDMPKEAMQALQAMMEKVRKVSKDDVNAMMNRTRSDDDVPAGSFSARARRGAISA